MTPALVWLLGLGVVGGAATAGARTLKKKNTTEKQKIGRLKELQVRNANLRTLQEVIGPGARLLNPIETWRLQTGGMIDLSKLPDAAREAMEQYNQSRRQVSEAINRQGGVRQDDDEEVGSDALATIDSFDRRFGPYLRAYILGRMGGAPDAGFGAVAKDTNNTASSLAKTINSGWSRGLSGDVIDRAADARNSPNPGMPQVKYMIPIWFRRMALQALADGVDPEGRVDILGQDVAIDDATAELNPDFSAWIATFSPSQSEIAMLVRNKRIPDSPGFWDKVWGGIVGTFKEVLSLDFLVNVATMGYADLTTGSNKASKAVTDQIKDKFGASEVLGWVGSGIDSSSGVTKMAPNPKPMTPEEKRIATWLASQYVTVPDPMVGPGAQDQRPWILRLDLALCGLWPILDVVQWMGGVEGLERSLIFATAPNGEMVIGGSRDLYQKPGQLVLRAMVVARRSLAGIEDRYTYGAASLLSMRQNRPDAAPTRTWFDWAANEDLKTGPLKEVWSYEGRKNNGETVRVQGDRTGAPAQNDAAAISYLDAQDQRSQGKAKLEGVKFVNIPSLPMIPAGPGTLAWLRSMTVGENGRVNSTAIATTFALGSLDDRTKSYVPRAYTKWSIAGPVPFTGKTWVSDANVDQMALEGDTETMSLTPQGRDKMKAAGG